MRIFARWRVAAFAALAAVLAGPVLAQTSASERSVLDQVKAHAEFSIFARALEATRYADVLRDGGPYTVFAFTDQAFRRLPDPFEDYLFSAEGTETLEQILAYHLVPGKATSSDMFGRVYEVPTLDGQMLTIEGQMDFIRVNGSTVLRPDIPARNGVVHLLEYVIIPPHF